MSAAKPRKQDELYYIHGDLVSQSNRVLREYTNPPDPAFYCRRCDAFEGPKSQCFEGVEAHDRWKRGLETRKKLGKRGPRENIILGWTPLPTGRIPLEDVGLAHWEVTELRNELRVACRERDALREEVELYRMAEIPAEVLNVSLGVAGKCTCCGKTLDTMCPKCRKDADGQRGGRNR